MKVSELAKASEVSVATVKYYLREGLLHPGRRTSATQATYDETHLERLRLIRVLRDVGDVPVASIGAVLDAIDDARRPLWEVLGAAHDVLALHPPPADVDDAVCDEIRAYLRSRAWDVDDDAPAIAALAEALEAVRSLWGPTGPEIFDPYTDAVDALADFELTYIDAAGGTASVVQQVIVGTVVFERAMVALRRLAEQHHSNRRFKPT